MNVHLTAELEAFVYERLATGHYKTAAEIIREGLRLLKEREERKRLLEKAILGGITAEESTKLSPTALKRVRDRIRASIEQGAAELDRGEGIDGEAFFASLLREKNGS